MDTLTALTTLAHLFGLNVRVTRCAEGFSAQIGDGTAGEAMSFGIDAAVRYVSWNDTYRTQTGKRINRDQVATYLAAWTSNRGMNPNSLDLVAGV